MMSTAKVICGGLQNARLSQGMEPNVAIIVVIGVVLAIGIAVFVKYLVDL
jgi:hypothetical protein